jgi:anhydro-N-acetylmuramic acid kinase
METTQMGLDVDAKEAIAFAVMAYETAHARPSNVPMATGAKKPVVLGKMTQNGGSRTSANGASSHKTPAPRTGKVGRPPVSPQAKAAATR